MTQKVLWLEAKLVVLLAIWIPNCNVEPKIMLTFIWFIKLVIDFCFYDFSPFMTETTNPILKFFESKGEYYKDLFVGIVSFLPSVLFEYIAISKKMKFLTIFGGISLIVYGFVIIVAIKDFMYER